MAAIVAMSASLAVAPGLLAPASAGAATPQRTSVTSECAAAKSALAVAKYRQAQAHRKVLKARKALRKAKHSHRPVKIRKAKRVLRKARHRQLVRTYDVRLQSAHVGYACSSSTSAAHARGIGMELQFLTIATGTVDHVIDEVGLKTLLDALLPGVSSQLGTGELAALLDGFNTGGLLPADAALLLGSVFSPDELTALLDGTASPELVQRLAAQIAGELSDLVGGTPVPGTVDVTALLGTLGGLLGGLVPTDGGAVCTLLPVLCP